MLKIGIMLGDDIGLEVVPEAVKVMKAAAAKTGLAIEWSELAIGKHGHDLHGHTFPQQTQQALENGWSAAQIWQRLRRPRILVYLVLWAVICSAWAISLSMRHDFKVDVIRDRGVLARIVSGGMIENVYRVQLMNASGHLQKLTISASGLPELQLRGETSVILEATQSKWVVLRLELPLSSSATIKSGSHPIDLTVINEETGQAVKEKSVFYIPR